MLHSQDTDHDSTGWGSSVGPSAPPTCWFRSPADEFALFLGETREVVHRLVASGVRAKAIFADPPYFLSDGGVTCQSGKMVSVDKGEWDRTPDVGDMHAFNLEWLGLCKDALLDDGTIWVSGTSHVIFSVGFAMQQLGFKILNDIAWEKPNPPPNLSCRYFTHATETVIWAAPSPKTRHTFNYQAMKELNGGKQMKSVWRLTAPSAAEKELGRHPTQKPLALLDRILLASTSLGDLVLDPFCGSGTTGISAVRLGRRFIGIDQEVEYLDLARRRFERSNSQPRLV